MPSSSSKTAGFCSAALWMLRSLTTATSIPGIATRTPFWNTSSNDVRELATPVQAGLVAWRAGALRYHEGTGMKHDALIACLILFASGCSESGLLVEVTIDESAQSVERLTELENLAFVVVEADADGSMQPQPLDIVDVRDRDL